MPNVTITVSGEDAALLEQVIDVVTEWGRDLHSIEKAAECAGVWNQQVGDLGLDGAVDVLESIAEDLLSLRAQDIRLSLLRDRLQAAQLLERRIA
jgi:hypothetical protein